MTSRTDVKNAPPLVRKVWGWADVRCSTLLPGRVMHEQDYRAVTKHVTPACANLPLTKVPVRLTPEESAAVAR